MVHDHRGGREGKEGRRRREDRGEREAGGGRERSEVTGVGPAASSRIQAATDREGTGVDLDLEEDDAFERERRLGQRGEGGRRREGKERGHRSRAGAGSELKDPGGDGSRAWEGGQEVRDDSTVTGKGGNPSRRPTLIYSGRGRLAVGLASWGAGLVGSLPPRAARAGRVIWPVPMPCHGPGRRPKHDTGPRAVPARARGPACRAGPWAVPKGRAVGRVGGPWAGWKSIVQDIFHALIV
jgi:hypothetical protein